MAKVSVLGDGAFGTAISLLLADNGHSVSLWCPDSQNATHINSERQNPRYAPGIFLPKTIHATADIFSALEHAQVIFEAIPVKYFRTVFQKIDTLTAQKKSWVILSKGIEPERGLLPTDILSDIFGFAPRSAVMVGPSFAKGLIQKDITGLSVATTDDELWTDIQNIVGNEYVSLYRSHDIIGTQLCAALKNVIACAVGIVEGAGYSDNTKALLITRGLEEMTRLVVAHGGEIQTTYGLAGVGDLVLTAMGSSSRNLAFGRLLGIGKTIEDVTKEMGLAPESLTTIHSIATLCAKAHGEFHILHGLVKYIHQEISLAEWIARI